MTGETQKALAPGRGVNSPCNGGPTGYNRAMRDRNSPSPLLLVCLTLAVLIPATYLAGYFVLPRWQSGATPEHRCRIFRWQWAATIYRPAGAVESAVTGNEIDVVCFPDQP
jgi:hypothetical protein